MNYKEQLDKANELGLNITDLTIAAECDCIFQFSHTREQFEELCDKVRQIYLASDTVAVWQVVAVINDLIVLDGQSVEEVISSNNKWEILDKASCY